MSLRSLVCAWWALFLLPASVLGQGSPLPPGEDEPLLRLEAGGPTSLVTGLAFSLDGNTLYEAGWDKVVHVWARDAEPGGFQLDARATYRVPIGPADFGAINALALSPDGTLLAVAANGVVRGGPGFRRSGLIIPAGAQSDEMLLDRGLIHVFNTRTHDVRILRGHLGRVLSLAFAPDRAGKPPLLVATAQERDGIGAVRLWDVSQGEYLGGIWNLPTPKTRPGLAVWHTGPGRTQIGVAIAWSDGALRLWDVAHDGGSPVVIADGNDNNTVCLLPAPEQERGAGLPRLLTASFQDGQGRLTSWEPTAERARPVRAGTRAPFPAAGNSLEVPIALALVAERAGAAPDHAVAVTLRVPPPAAGAARTGQAGLELIDLRPGRFGTVTVRVPLWDFDARRPSLPVLAVDPGGRSVAVTGAPDRTVLVFSLADLRQGRADAKPQVLRGDGVTIGRVAFVRNGPDRGLRLVEAAGSRGGDAPASAPGRELIFDFTRSKLTAEPDGWQDTAPAAGDWRVDVVPGSRDAPGQATAWALAVRQGAGPAQRVGLRPGQVITASALLPPSPTRRAPVAAIAFQEAGEPGLGLYNALTGEQIRQFSGHAESIRDLAFSDDGRLLASTAEDRTVCVWSLTDLDQTLGRRGALAGVAVTERDGNLTVTRVDPDSPAAAGDVLRVGDVIRGMVTAGAARTWATAAEFYQALSLLTPGGSMILRRARGRGQSNDVVLRVGQAIDERKPLLSLFLTRGDTPEQRAWIGWSPLGPYESSGRDAERLLGWHFNTGKAAAPTRFALADQYRQFHRPGLLKDLIDRGGPVQDPAPPPLQRPNMSLTIDPEGEIDGQSQLLVRRPPSAFNLVLLNQNVPTNRVESIRWKIDDAPWGELAPTADGIWSVDLSRVAWRRGEHRVVVSLRTREATPQEFSEWRAIRYQPPPPIVEADQPRRDGKVVVVDRPEFIYRARVTPAQGRVKVQLVHRTTGGLRSRNDWQGDAPMAISHPLTLEPGDNSFELSAVNQDALGGYEEFETTRLPPQHLHYQRAPARPPEVVLEKVIPLGDRSVPGRPLTIGAGEATVVAVPRVRVLGRIAGAAALSAAEWTAGPTFQQLGGFVANRAPTFALSEVLDLEPGARTYRFRARVADSEFAEAGLALEYRPPLPELAELTLDPPGDVIDYQGRQADPPRVRLKARLLVPAGGHPYRAAIMVNDKDRPEAPLIDEGAALLTALVPIQPGDNQIRVRLANAWNAASVTEPVVVTYRRPPRIIALERPVVGNRPFIDITATVDSPDDLPLIRAQVDVQGGEPGSPARVIDGAELRREGAGWVVSARDVPIEPGENVVRLWTWNADGPCREPAKLTGLVYQAAPAPKPEVEILSPGSDSPVHTASVAVEFIVRSTSPLKKVELVRVQSDRDQPVLYSASIAEARRNANGDFELRATTTVALNPQTNRLQVVATNAGGDQAAHVTVSYIPPPVRILIERLVPEDRGEPAIVTAGWEGDRNEFAAQLRDGKVMVCGRVVWPDLVTRRQQDQAQVQVWINGYPQRFAALRSKPGAELEAEFEVPVLFNRRDNRIEVKLPNLVLEACDRTVLRVACERPELRQRLHLLIVGVGHDDGDALRDRALKAFEGRLLPDSKTTFETPAFSEGRIYGPLIHDVRKTRIAYQLGLIKNSLNPHRSATGATSEVVVVYYQGDEWVEGKRSYLRLRPVQSPGRNDVVAVDELTAFFARARGAQLWVMDVTRSTASSPRLLGGAPTQTDAERTAGLLRFSWRQTAGVPSVDPPNNARLLTVLEEAIPRASTVGDLDSAVSKKYLQLEKDYPNLTYDRFLPEGMVGLIVGRP